MRHSASVIRELEGLSRPAYDIARELTQNSRSGLTIRFLSKKLELPEEEIEYLIDVNHRLFFQDITKVKLVAEGGTAVRRIGDGLRNHGDVPSLFNAVKSLGPHEFRRLEEQIGIEKPGGKKAAAEDLLERFYTHPENLVEYVATRGFSPLAQEVFDLLWQSRTGVLSIDKIRAKFKVPEYEVEQALLELFQGFALFEMFRFDAEERLVRVAGLLSELRQYRENERAQRRKKVTLKAARGTPDVVDERGVAFSDAVCRLVAAIAAKPARLRGDGDLFREDRRRLGEIVAEEDEPSLQTCLWIAEGAGWIARVDNELRAADIEDLIGQDRVTRHQILFDWLLSKGGDTASRRILANLADSMKPGAWYDVMRFIDYAMQSSSDDAPPVLKHEKGQWKYVGASAAGTGRGLARVLEETFLWLGVVDRAIGDEGPVFRVSELGRYLLNDTGRVAVLKQFPNLGAEIVVQPNFDIIVPTQDVDPLLTVPLDQFAVRGSTGSATVYTVTKDSFTKAVQDGHDGDAFVQFLLDHNRGHSLPANVMTTLEDWRGGMKRVRLRTVHVIESDDPLVMADLVHRRKFAKLVKPADPQRTATYTGVTKAELAKQLEKEGFVVE